MADLTPEDQLRWVIQFTRENLDALSPAERVARGYRLRVLDQPSRPLAIEDAWEPMPDVRLGKLQAEIAAGLRALVGEEGRWEVPRAEVSADLTRVYDPGQKTFRLGLAWAGREPEIILHQIANLVHRYGQRLRACARCQSPFLPKKRQIYCSRACSQAVQTQRYRERHREEFLTYRREAYRRRQQQRYGPKVRIASGRRHKAKEEK
jgi:hypothetical protein